MSIIMRIRDVLDGCVDGDCEKKVDYKIQERKGKREDRRERIRICFVW